MSFLPSSFRFIPVLLVMGGIFWLSHQTGNSLDLPDIPFIDKAAHLMVYAILATAAMFALAGPSGRKKTAGKNLAIPVVLFCFVYGLSDEFHQYFIPGRSPSASDILADVAGAVLAVWIWNNWQRRRQSTSAALGLTAD